MVFTGLDSKACLQPLMSGNLQEPCQEPNDNDERTCERCAWNSCNLDKLNCGQFGSDQGNGVWTRSVQSARIDHARCAHNLITTSVGVSMKEPVRMRVERLDNALLAIAMGECQARAIDADVPKRGMNLNPTARSQLERGPFLFLLLARASAGAS